MKSHLIYYSFSGPSHTVMLQTFLSYVWQTLQWLQAASCKSTMSVQPAQMPTSLVTPWPWYYKVTKPSQKSVFVSHSSSSSPSVIWSSSYSPNPIASFNRRSLQLQSLSQEETKCFLTMGEKERGWMSGVSSRLSASNQIWFTSNLCPCLQVFGTIHVYWP